MRGVRASGSTAATCAPTSINWADAIPASAPTSNAPMPSRSTRSTTTPAGSAAGGGRTHRRRYPNDSARRRSVCAGGVGRYPAHLEWSLAMLPTTAIAVRGTTIAGAVRRVSVWPRAASVIRLLQSRTEPFQLFEGPPGVDGSPEPDWSSERVKPKQIKLGYRRRRCHRDGRAGRGVQRRERRSA